MTSHAYTLVHTCDPGYLLGPLKGIDSHTALHATVDCVYMPVMRVYIVSMTSGECAVMCSTS